MASDLRTKITKRLIVEHFIMLLEEKPLREVTVTAICKSAEINRSTFYRYYTDPFDLFNKLEEWLLDTMEQYAEIFRKGLEVRSLTTLMTFLDKNKHVYRVMTSKNGNPYLTAKLVDRTYEFLSSHPDWIYPEMSEMQYHWLYQYTAYGCLGMIISWLNSETQVPIDTLVSFMIRCTEKVNEVSEATEDIHSSKEGPSKSPIGIQSYDKATKPLNQFEISLNSDV